MCLSKLNRTYTVKVIAFYKKRLPSPVEIEIFGLCIHGHQFAPLPPPPTLLKNYSGLWPRVASLTFYWPCFNTYTHVETEISVTSSVKQRISYVSTFSLLTISFVESWSVGLDSFFSYK